MNNADLKTHLKNLHKELTTAEVIDEGSKRLLEKIQDDVRFLLDHNGNEYLPHHATVKERLAESGRHFNATHPRLAATIRTVVNTLNNMGI